MFLTYTWNYRTSSGVDLVTLVRKIPTIFKYAATMGKIIYVSSREIKCWDTAEAME